MSEMVKRRQSQIAPRCSGRQRDVIHPVCSGPAMPLPFSVRERGAFLRLEKSALGHAGTRYRDETGTPVLSVGVNVNMADWSESELAELGPMLRGYIEASRSQGSLTGKLLPARRAARGSAIIRDAARGSALHAGRRSDCEQPAKACGGCGSGED